MIRAVASRRASDSMPPSSHARDLAPHDAAPAGTLPSLVRALAFGAVVVVAALLVAWMAGLVPVATRNHVVFGVAAALLASTAAVWLHGRFLDPRAAQPFAQDGRLMAGRVQSLMAAAFGVKLAVLVVVVLYLQRVLSAEHPDVKFAATASFCIAFAAASLVCQLATAGYLARAFSRRRTSPLGAAPVTVPDPVAPHQPRR